MTTPAPTDLPSMLAEIKGRIYQNGIGAITAVIVQGVLDDMLGVLGLVASAAAVVATDVEVANLTPGLMSQATSAGTAAAVAAEPAIVQAATAAAQSLATLAGQYAAGALASENAAQAILNSYLDDGVQGLGAPGSSFDDGVQGQ